MRPKTFKSAFKRRLADRFWTSSVLFRRVIKEFDLDKEVVVKTRKLKTIEINPDLDMSMFEQPN